jgi:hypothetical protein
MENSPNFRIAAELYSALPLPASTDKEPHSIRLITLEQSTGKFKISCRLRAVPFEDAATNGYFALSYVWGDATITETIEVNGLPFQATANLVAALQWYSTSELASYPIWVDAICINQCDIPERNAQVRFMGMIYTCAWEALCFLGPEADALDAATFHLINALAQDLKDPDMLGEDPPLTPLKDPVYSVLISRLNNIPLLRTPVLYDRVYWTRLWTFQEVVLAPAARLIAGACTCYFQDLEEILHWVHTEPRETLIRRGKTPDGVSTDVWNFISELYFDVTAYWTTDVSQTRQDLRARNLTEDKLRNAAVARTVARGCYDPRDKLYGLAGIIDIGIEVDYAVSVATVYTRFASDIVSKSDDLYFIFGFVVNGQLDSKFGLPSWVPNYTSPQYFHPFRLGASANLNAPSTAKQVTINGNLLRLRGVTVDVVSDVMPAESGPEATFPPNNEWTRSRTAGVAQFLLHRNARTILSETLTEPGGQLLYRTGIPLLQAVLRLIGDDIFTRFGMFSTAPHSVIRPETLPMLVDSLISSDPSVGQHMAQLWLDRDPVDEFKVKDTLSSVLDPLRTESLRTEDVIRAASAAYDPQALSQRLGQFPFVQSDLTVPFHTETGYIGYGLRGVQQGDVVTVIGSCSMPVILRKAADGSDRYTLVSMCHVIGLRSGEAWKGDRSVDLQEFNIV